MDFQALLAMVKGSLVQVFSLVRGLLCECIFIHGGQCLWIVKTLLVRIGRNFNGNWFTAIQCKTVNYFGKSSWGC